MKAKPVKKNPNGNGMMECVVQEATHIELRVPSGVLEYRQLPIQIGGTRNGTNNWSWNGDVDKPTLKPSILTRASWAGEPFICHSFVNNGKVQFLNDCTHEFAGQTLDLMEVPNE